MVAEELEAIRKHLTRGDQLDIATRLGVTKQYVNAVLRGQRTNLKVLEEAVKLAQVNKERKDELNQKIQAL